MNEGRLVEICSSTPYQYQSPTMSSLRGSGRGRGRGSRPRPGPPAWPHGTAPENRLKFVAIANKTDKICEPVEVDWDEMRRQVS